ncbi:hypothetical protein Scep_009261 [Stephania cephalantha]|uniref:Retrotransposon Copia-like N-terminal domain-containing protein n=1 Tax=Stephania cephalantha TaxID=152367 RepID=A0AAP0JTT2_9MAGN
MDDDPATTREAMEPVQARNPEKETPTRSSMEQTTIAMVFQSGGFYMSGPSSVIDPFGHALSRSISIKLDENNYPLWKTLMMPSIRGHNLDGIMLGEVPCPPKIDQETGDFNPRYQDWIFKDQMLLRIILNSMTQSIMSQILKVASSSTYEVWQAIANLYGAQI